MSDKGADPLLGDDLGGEEPASTAQEYPEEFNILPADHPLLAPVQAALASQLQKEYDRAKFTLNELTNRQIKATKRHEEIGVDLFNSQQRLAQSQVELEELAKKVQEIRAERVRLKASVQEQEQALEKKRAEVTSMEHEVEIARKEIEQLTAESKDMERYNLQVRSEISVTKRTAYRTEEEIKDLEKKKIDQDFMIDQRQRKINQLESDIAMLGAQVEAQDSELRQARAILAEATAEMEAIAADKGQLNHQWESALNGLEKRNVALREARAALENFQGATTLVQHEITGVKKQVHEEEEGQMHLAELESHAKEESVLAQKRIETSAVHRAELEELLGSLANSTRAAEEAAALLQRDIRSADKECHVLDRDIEKVSAQRVEVLSRIALTNSEISTTDHQKQHLLISEKKTRALLRDLEKQTAMVENELTKTELDCLNTEAVNGSLKVTLAQLDERIAERNKLVSKYETQVRRTNDLIEKRSNDAIRLNKKLETLRSKMSEGEDSGPLETIVHSLQKQIQQVRRECSDQEAQWLRGQNDLVALSKRQEELWQELQVKQKQAAVLQAKRDRVETEITRKKKKIAEINADSERLHLQLSRISAGIAEKSGKQEKLNETNFALESSFISTLKDLEAESNRLEAQISAARESRALLEAELIEVEKQKMYWQRKIRIESEIQQTLNPSASNNEAASVRKETALMELRLSQVKREQRILVKRMEVAVGKREAIANRGRAAAASKNRPMKRAAPSNLQIKQELTRVKRDTLVTEKAAQDAEKEFGLRLQERQKLQTEVDELNGMCELLRAKLTGMEQP
eukprot:gnl/Chilomastix_cuspidata/383.p1 GENE.gnl/Chilomastix_cuspidata/383~~gnl/Chilomastix_cuspidata/383.p1  ORF type:complete len:809 (-),score=318.24 gnl/Chilomastix_cuspidata/383:622-3048(-)